MTQKIEPVLEVVHPNCCLLGEGPVWDSAKRVICSNSPGFSKKYAVASEYFFEKPGEFEHMHPDIYQLLCQVFDQHPTEI